MTGDLGDWVSRCRSNEWGGLVSDLMMLAVHDQGDGTVVIDVGGEVDVYTADRLRKALGTAIDAGPDRVVVDLTGLRFLASEGLGVLIGATKRAGRAGCGLVVRGAQANVRRVFELTGVHRLLDLAD